MADKKSDAAENVVVSAPVKQEHGAQVHLTGEARAAARGGLAGDLMGNTLAKTALEADGAVADGGTPDGTTRTGEPQPDDLRSDAPDAPVDPSRVRVEGEDGKLLTGQEAVKDRAEAAAPEPTPPPSRPKR